MSSWFHSPFYTWGQERCVNCKNQKWTFHSFVSILSLLCHHKRFVFRISETCKLLGKKASERLWSRRGRCRSCSIAQQINSIIKNYNYIFAYIKCLHFTDLQWLIECLAYTKPT